MVGKKVLLSLCFMSSLVYGDLFEKGKYSFGFSAGLSSTYKDTYTLLGVSGNYFLMNNLNLGLAYRGWFGADPMRNELALSTNYFVPLSQKFRPYIGAFVRETFVSGLDDYTSYGARGGVSIITDNSYVSVGYAYEQFSNCIINNKCSTSYPEIVVGLSF